MLDFSYIKNLFPKNEWDVGYISATQLKICAYNPVKGQNHLFGLNFTNSIHFEGFRNCIVLIRQTDETGDYSFYKEAANIMSKTFLKWCMIYTNFKEAALQAGLGVTAKNSLVYTYRFGFDSKICVIGFDETITNIPTNKRVNKKLWNRCIGCWDCAINCPVKAIHNDGDKMENNWVDSQACDEFIGLSDHPRIPSIKKFWHENVHPEIPKKEVSELNTAAKVQEKYKKRGFPFDKNGYAFHPSFGAEKDGKPVTVPFCRECTSQPRCSKWKGHYPYSGTKSPKM
jgi:ferredoxin